MFCLFSILFLLPVFDDILPNNIPAQSQFLVLQNKNFDCERLVPSLILPSQNQLTLGEEILEGKNFGRFGGLTKNSSKSAKIFSRQN